MDAIKRSRATCINGSDEAVGNRTAKECGLYEVRLANIVDKSTGAQQKRAILETQLAMTNI
jgi:hypothetical protein